MAETIELESGTYLVLPAMRETTPSDHPLWSPTVLTPTGDQRDALVKAVKVSTENQNVDILVVKVVGIVHTRGKETGTMGISRKMIEEALVLLEQES